MDFLIAHPAAALFVGWLGLTTVMGVVGIVLMVLEFLVGLVRRR